MLAAMAGSGSGCRPGATAVSFDGEKILAGKILAQKYHLRMTSATPDHIGQILAQWRRERPDLDVAPMGLLGRLFRVVQLADATLTKSLADRYGLQPGWFDLLAALRRAGAPYELNPTQLTRATMLSSGGMTKRLDRMAEAGLVERRADPADRRGTLVRLTRRGRSTIDKAVAAHLANEDRLLRSLSAADRRTLDQLLRTLLADLEATGSSQDGHPTTR
jgi:DNA-binding MarR family transcriptional regulator